MILQPGARLGPYEIAGRIDTGGQGVVYKARDTRLRRDVALKLLTAKGESNLDDLLREARMVAALNHPHICTVSKLATVDGMSFVAMEHINGESLRSLISAGRWSADRVWRIGRQLADALEHAHAHGVVHRDFKSGNVMITSDGRAKVVDFGISVRTAGSTERTETAQLLEADDRVSGTVPYMAPEILQGEWPSPRSDIWALGVVLYEMTSGRRPFEARTSSELAAAILRDPPPSLHANAPPALVRLIERCLAKDPVDRPSRAGEVALVLEVTEPRPSSPTDSVVVPRRFTHRSRVMTGVVAGSMIGLAYWLWSSTPRDSSPPRFGNPVRVTAAVGVEEFPAWSPDGRTLAYVGRVTGSVENSSANSDIWVAQPGGGPPINRTADYVGQDLFPTWSPDGSQIAFWSDRDGAGCYVMAALSGTPRRIATANQINPNPPLWSGDGRELLCVNGDTRASVDIVSLQTGEVRRSIHLPGETPRFVTRSRDERRIAFVNGPGGLSADVSRLSVLDVDTLKGHAGNRRPDIGGEPELVGRRHDAVLRRARRCGDGPVGTASRCRRHADRHAHDADGRRGYEECRGVA